MLLGEPGSGKSQFARAAAKALGRAFEASTLDARTETHDLLWRYDPVGRLAQAQLVSALSGDAAQDAVEATDLKRFIRPGPLWWGFNWDTACDRIALCDPEAMTEARQASGAQGVVVLIDEIDKADPSVPNALLEALGNRSFSEPGGETIHATGTPLVIIASNEERELSQAFQRRCAVHRLEVPSKGALVTFLLERGIASYPDEDPDLLRIAAEMTAADREATDQAGLRPLPGQAEYFDLLAALFSDSRNPKLPAEKALEELAPYFLRKKLGRRP